MAEDKKKETDEETPEDTPEVIAEEPISRWDIYNNQLSEADMKTEGKKALNPKGVKRVKLFSEDDKIFIEGENFKHIQAKLNRFYNSKYPNGFDDCPKSFDDRFYFVQPFIPAKLKYPVEVTLVESSSEEAADNAVSPASNDGETAESGSDTKYPEETSASLGVPAADRADDAKTHAAIAVVEPENAWYNKKKKGNRIPLMGISEAGLKPKAAITDSTWQNYLMAVNKRLLKVWMGELKNTLHQKSPTTTKEQLNALYAWFASADGRSHFRGWCEKLGKHGGNRPGKGPHSKGFAMDINYEFNPWCPLVMTENNGSGNKFLKSYDPTGECPGAYKKFYKDCLVAYERALRIFVPIETCERPGSSSTNSEDANQSAPGDVQPQTSDDSAQSAPGNNQPQTTDEFHWYASMKFGEKYYRNHWDWTCQGDDRDWLQCDVELVHQYYSTLSWALRFYFNYRYKKMEIHRDLDETKNEFRDDNLYTTAHVGETPRTDAVFWEEIKTDIMADGVLPESSHLLIQKDEAIISSANAEAWKTAGIIEEVSVAYFFELGPDKTAADRTVKTDYYCIRLNQGLVNAVAQNGCAAALGKTISEQIKYDHNKLSYGMIYEGYDTEDSGKKNVKGETIWNYICWDKTTPKKTIVKRDPCHGVFNHSWDFIMSFCYLLKDRPKVRAFGNFSPRTGGDLQHFDYGSKQSRPNLKYTPPEGGRQRKL